MCDLVNGINEQMEILTPEILQSISVTDGKIEKIGQTIHIEGKNIVLKFDNLCQLKDEK